MAYFIPGLPLQMIYMQNESRLNFNQTISKAEQLDASKTI